MTRLKVWGWTLILAFTPSPSPSAGDESQGF